MEITLVEPRLQPSKNEDEQDIKSIEYKRLIVSLR